ncbi:MAG: PIG-L deacetylase family protein [bacterium]|nr:PIG-L deacetylase family protein [bacterium]
MKKVLVIAPHQDDEVFGCGGAIAKISSEINVSVGFILDGVSGVPSAHSREEAMKVRKDEANAAAQVLGVKNLYFLDFEDRGFVYSRETLHEIIRLIRNCSPSSIWFPHKNDGDIEHQVVHGLVEEAIWMAAGPFFPELGKSVPVIEQLFCYEVWTPLQEYQIKVDITSTVKIKRKAMTCYKSQLEQTNYGEAILGLNRYRAMSSNAKYIEAFQILQTPFEISG